MKLKDVISPFYVWKRAFEKPYTNTNPLETRDGSANYRGFHANDIEMCIGCGTCEAVCQNAAIDMVPVEGVDTTMSDSGLRPKIDYGRCCWCALCVDVCTTASLRLTNEYTWFSSDKDEDFRFIPGIDKKSWDDNELGYRRHEGLELLDYKRQAMDHIPFEDSTKSFIEMFHGYSAKQAKLEAERCVDCGLCIAKCPAHMDIPEYIKAIRDGDFELGAKILYATNPMPATCGRICTHLCETVCSIGVQGDPVAIRWLKRYIIDQIEPGDLKDALGEIFPDNGKKVAIIGAGPGGLSAAYYLRQLGYSTTIYEGREAAGGMIRYGVPEYRMPYDQIDKETNYLKECGVEFKFNTYVGRDIQLENLMDDYDAVYFSVGLTIPYGLGIEGEEHPRVLSGLQVLDDATERVEENPNIGKSVAVIGGGNVAMDCCRVSKRYDADVHLYYRRRISEMPADSDEIHESQGEGVVFHTQAIPVRVEPADNPNQVKLVWGEAEMVTPKDGGRPRPVLQEDKIHTDTFDCIIKAIGQEGNYEFFTGEYKEKLETKWGKIIHNEYMQTSIPKLFVGGDIANPQADAISAIADGHLAAKGIDLFLLHPDDKQMKK